MVEIPCKLFFAINEVPCEGIDSITFVTLRISPTPQLIADIFAKQHLADYVVRNSHKDPPKASRICGGSFRSELKS